MATDMRDIPASKGGLTTSQVQERISRGAVNTFQEGPSRTTREIIRANVVTRFNILLGALLLVILLAVQEPRDALFGIVLVANSAIGIIQELRAKATLDRLAVLTSPTIRVIRDGTSREIHVDNVVEDDIIQLRSGDQLPVDGTVLETRGLEINESLLTGESDPILKIPGDPALSGSFVVAGSGRYRADRVGADAYAASLAREAKKFTMVRSELRDGIDLILKWIIWAVVPVILLLLYSQNRLDFPKLESTRSAVAGAVGMVPQGLVLLTSVAFAVGVIRLGKRNVLVQELPAIEGLARVDIVCFDKTGTLTEGSLVVHAVELLGDDVDTASALGALGAVEAEPNATLQAIADNYPPSDGWRAVETAPFSSARKWSGATFAGHGTWVLGAPEILAPKNHAVTEATAEHAAQGHRVVLLARSAARLETERLPGGLSPVALVVLGDKIRDDAEETLRFFAEQGVQTKVISGDHPETVGAVARTVGVPGSHEVIDARNLPTDPEQFSDIIELASVFGRVTPHQKREMVGALQARGHVVAMTGDGVNDVLALKDADIGIALGSGSPASRAVAQLVLIDGSFATLPGVVAEGRRVIGNIERVAYLFVTKTVYAICLAVAVGVLSRPFPFLPRHLTLVGSVTIGIPAFFLALEPTAHRARRGFIKRVLRFSIPTGLAAGFATLWAYELAISSEDVTLTEARTTATLVLAALGLFALGMVSRPLKGWKKGLLWAMSILLLVLVTATGSREFFELDRPRLVVLMAAVGVVAIAGGAMLGTLRAVGWLRGVPEYLREHPPRPERTWKMVRARLRSALGGRDEPGDSERWFKGRNREGNVGPGAEEKSTQALPAQRDVQGSPPRQEHDADEQPRPVHRPSPTEWFDPDNDPLADIEPFDPEKQGE